MSPKRLFDKKFSKRKVFAPEQGNYSAGISPASRRPLVCAGLCFVFDLQPRHRIFRTEIDFRAPTTRMFGGVIDGFFENQKRIAPDWERPK
jgi:hypothetical protein